MHGSRVFKVESVLMRNGGGEVWLKSEGVFV